MARALKSTTVQFGMVVMPVKVYPATQDKSVGMFNQIHRECGGRIKMPKTCPQCNRAVDGSELVKGFPLGKNKEGKEEYVIITEEELESLPLETSVNIAIDAFVSSEEMEDPRIPTNCYYMSPEDTAKKPFVMLVKAMEDTGKWAVAKVALKEQKEHLCLIRPFGGILILQTLHWSDEIRDFTELKVEARLNDKELELAKSLVNAMTKEVDLSSYKDEYRKAVIELVTAKREGKNVLSPVAVPKASNDDAMMDALLASIVAESNKRRDALLVEKKLSE
ncbi:MAG: Ku protein [Candidatus Marinimicrobia bacterium]|nr:Ku protein [Candidatus Neomarinimicrobiota bacterium]